MCCRKTSVELIILEGLDNNNDDNWIPQLIYSFLIKICIVTFFKKRVIGKCGEDFFQRRCRWFRRWPQINYWWMSARLPFDIFLKNYFEFHFTWFEMWIQIFISMNETTINPFWPQQTVLWCVFKCCFLQKRRAIT